MQLDWSTVALEVVNFLVLVWLLKRFLYGRILHAIEARESKIAARIAEEDELLKIPEAKKVMAEIAARRNVPLLQGAK